MARPKNPILVSAKEQKLMEAKELLNDFLPTADQLKELSPQRGEDNATYVNRIVWFSLQQIILIALTTEQDALAAKIWMHINNLGITPKSAIDISVRRSPVDDMDDEELIKRMVDRLVEHPMGRKMLEDKLKDG